MKLNKEVQFFLDGHKPSYLPQGKINDNRLAKILKKYPKLPDGHRKGAFYFFQNEQQLQSFLINYDNCANVSQKFFVLGINLGYPPKACEYFAHEREKTVTPDVFINFCGLYFRTSFDLIEDNLSWLINTYDVCEEKSSLLLDIRTSGESKFFRYKGKIDVRDVLKDITKGIDSERNKSYEFNC